MKKLVEKLADELNVFDLCLLAIPTRRTSIIMYKSFLSLFSSRFFEWYKFSNKSATKV